MLTRWLPWKFLIRRAVNAYGIIDPFIFMARLRRFAQPSEVEEPIELLRAGIAFHARGLINTRAIQYNLDWIWPFWVQKQFNPDDPSFITRGFSFSHVNLTHRNWTAVGQPDLPLYPIVDPRGLVTPLYDGWSIDFWLASEGSDPLLPSCLEDADQFLEFAPGLTINTRCADNGRKLDSSVRMEDGPDGPVVVMDVRGTAPADGCLVAALRPYNPEGIQFIEDIAWDETKNRFRVDDDADVRFDSAPGKVVFSNYTEGDVLHKIGDGKDRRSVSCDIGMASAAALFHFKGGETAAVQIRVPLKKALEREELVVRKTPRSWDDWLSDAATLRVPDPRIQFLYDAAVRTVILLSADEIVPGPYTYRRFWFRDACLMLNSLLALGLGRRAHRILATFPERQKLNGYFRSQEGEWDSNGQVLWIAERYSRLTGRDLDADWIRAIRKGADWIIDKRKDTAGEGRHAGLLPAGFSAEHLGPNDYYYWDDFWGLAGLRAAAQVAERIGDEKWKKKMTDAADEFEAIISGTIDRIPDRMKRGGIPASPYRRMDAGAIGSMVADYPLHLKPAKDEAIRTTAEFLMSKCFYSGAFFQDMIHSGLNVYLTLAIAQTLLRNGDLRFQKLIERVAELASPTGQWPEAIHPRTGGGCMGDGQHGWAAAEWIMMMRNLFVREEGDGLVIGSGIFPDWLRDGEPLHFGPTLTPHGPVTVTVSWSDGHPVVSLGAEFGDRPPEVTIDVPGYETAVPADPTKPCHLKRIQKE